MAQYLSDDEVFGGAGASAPAYLSDDEVFGARDEAPPTDFSEAATGMMSPGKPAAAKPGPKPEGTWDDPREGSFDDRGEARKGVDSAITGIKSMRPAFGIAGSSLVVQRIGERLENWDKIDRGENVPRAEGLAYQRADAAGRQKLREEQLSVAAQQKDFIADSVKLVKQYQQEQQRNKGATSDFTDIESVKGFEDWLKFNGAAGAVYLAPVMISAAVGGPAGALATSYVLAAGEQNSDRVAAAIDMNRPGRFKNPDRQDAVDQTQGIAARVAETVPQTAAFAVPNALMDAASGPVRSVITKPLQNLTRREAAKAAPGMIGRDVVEEGITGTLQEGVNIAAERYAGEQQGDILTRENAKRLINAGTAEAAGGLVGGSAMAGAGIATAPTVRTPEQSAASVMAAPTVDEAIAAATAETSAPLPAAAPPAQVRANTAAAAVAPTNQEAAAAVDNIGRILGQPQETTNVGDPVGTPGQPASSSGAGGNVGVGSVLDRGLQPDVGGRGNGPSAGVVGGDAAPVPARSGNPAGADALAPAAVWFGRAGNGYATQEDAAAAIPSRQRVHGDLDWKIEQTPEGRFRLAGYAQNGVVPTQSGVAQDARPFNFTLNPTGTLTVKGDQQAIRQTLTNAGVTQFAAGTSGVMVGKSQAQQAVQALQALEPQVRDVTQRIQQLEQATSSVAAAPAQRENVGDGPDNRINDSAAARIAGSEGVSGAPAAGGAGDAQSVRPAVGMDAAPDAGRRDADGGIEPPRVGAAVLAANAATDRRSDGARTTVAAPSPDGTAPAAAEVAAPQFRATLNPTGTLAIQGDVEAIKATLRAAGITQGVVKREGGVLVGKSQAQAAQRLPAFQTNVAERGGNPFRTFLMRQGVSLKLAREFAPGAKERLAMGRTFREGGLELDALAERAAEQGFISDRSQTDELYEMISRAVAGERIAPLVGQDADLELQSIVDARRQDEEARALAALAALTDNEVSALADPEADIPWDQLGEPSTLADGLRALGASEQEIPDAEAEVARGREGAQADADRSDGAGEAAGSEARSDAASREGQAQEGLSDAPTLDQRATPATSPTDAAARDVEARGGEVRRVDRARAEGLASPTQEEVVDQQRRREEGERAESSRRTEEDNRARADAQRDEFGLTGSDRAADANPAQRDAFDADMRAQPFDHGELNIPGRTKNINRDLDRYKAEQERAQKADAKQAAAKRKEDKARAKEVFAEVWPAMLEKMGPKFGEKQLRETLDSMVKWEPAKFLAMAEKFRKEQGGKDAFDTVMRHRAFHGTPHDFDRFTTDAIGSGEGAQAYGWGLYFAENEVVADGYRKTLSGDVMRDGKPINRMTTGPIQLFLVDMFKNRKLAGLSDEVAREQTIKWAKSPGSQTLTTLGESKIDEYVSGLSMNKGALYQVDIPDEVVARMLLWDKPLIEQPERIKQALRKVMEKHSVIDFDEYAEAGNDYRDLKDNALPDLSEKEVSEALDAAGIPGIRYLDGGSRPRNDVVDVRARELIEKHDGDIEAALAEFMRSVYTTPKEKAKISAVIRKDMERYQRPTYNLVVFNDKNVTITHKDGSPVTKAERDAFMEDARGRGGISPEQRDANFRRWSNDAPLVKSAEADTYAFKTGQKVVLEAFHGTKRPDRVGEVFQRKRATSGPMAFFTSAPVLASSYAQGKDDTSLSYEDQEYAAWFKYKPQGSRTPVDIVRSFYFLPQETRERIAELAPRVMTDDTGENLILGPEGHTSGNGGYDQALVESRRGSYDRQGNPLKALVDAWLNSAALFNEEERFLEVLKLAGFPVSEVIYDNPNAEYPAVYKAFVFMQQPLVTNDIPGDVILALQAAAKRDRSRAEAGGADMWDKNTRTLREWVKDLTQPQNGSAQYVWTSIPDKVTEVFKSLGYDGIIDWSGKGGGTMHPVYIPFSESQVKSATGNKGTFDADSKNILRRRSADTGTDTLRRAEVQRIVDDLTAKWKDKPQITVVESVEDLPGEHPADTRGLYSRGHVWIVAGAPEHRTRDGIAKTLAHEAVAHYGLRAMLGKTPWETLMDRIHLGIKSNNKALLALQKEVRKAYVDENGDFELSPREEADEIAAKAVEEAIDADGNFRPGFAFLKAVFARVAQFLRERGIDVTFSNAELQGMLVLSMRNMERGQRTAGGGGMVLVGSPTARATSMNVLKAISKIDRLFRLPKSDKDTVAEIAAEVDPAITVKLAAQGRLTTIYSLTLPDGTKTSMYVRKPNPYGSQAYGMMERDGDLEAIPERPGTNPEAVDQDMEDVYVDVSKLKEGGGGSLVYNIAATFAHNTGRIFIGDPASLSAAALRRRTEQMLSSALKFGTTRHIAPHPRQVEGDRKLGVPGMRWTYGDDLGNIESLVQTSLAAFDYAEPNPLTFEPSTGRFVDRSGAELDDGAISRLVEAGAGREARAGVATLKRNAILRSLLPAGGTDASARGRSLLEGLLDVAGQPGAPADRVFYARGVADQTETPAFKRWFGDSKAVDAEGKPLVMYHGTARSFTEFRASPGWYGTGIYLTDNPDSASTYADERAEDADAGDGANVMPVYVRMVKPYRFEPTISGVASNEQLLRKLGFRKKQIEAAARDYEQMADLAIERLREQGYDGLIVGDEYTGEGREYIAFDPEQIKSAIGNSGDFDAFDADIRHARGGTAAATPDAIPDADGWQMPEATRGDKVLYELQDGRVDLRRAVEAIKQSGREIEERFDARLAETLFPGRVAYRSQTFLEQEVKPLLTLMAANRMKMDEISDFLIARHAPERNEQVAKVNPDMPDGGAGRNSEGTLMTTKAAEEYIAGIEPARRKVLENVAARIDAITAGTRGILVQEGLEKPEVVGAWESAYKFYAPLFKDEADAGVPHPVGTGFNVRGKASKRAMGSQRQVTDVLGHVLMQREAAITRAEKNRVGLSLYGLVLANPNPDFWAAIRPNMPAGTLRAQLTAMGVDPDEAAAAMDGVPTVRTVDEATNRVVERPNPLYKSLPGAITLKVAGEDRVIMLNMKDERAVRLAESMKNLDGLTKLDIAGSVVGKATRWIASVNTQYNPVFGFVNVVRDLQNGIVNLTSTKLSGHKAEVLGNVPAALIGIARDLRGDAKRTEWSDLFVRFQEAGGKTGYRELFRDAADRTKAIERELKTLESDGRLTIGRAAHSVLALLDDFNTALENAVRLSAFKAGIDSGLSEAESARIARELTVDFNRKGRTGREVGPLYAFFNASMQGTARTIATLKGPAGAKIIAGGVGIGIMQALMLAAAGFDDDDLPEFVKSRNLIIPTAWRSDRKTYIAIPLGLGLHVLPNTGRIMTEMMLGGGRHLGEKLQDAVGEIVGAFNPMGSANPFTLDGALKTAAPTVVDPMIELGFNKNFFGGQVERRPFSEEGDNRPGFTRARESTQRSTTGQVYLGISKAINTMTGGTDYEAGKASPTPEAVRYLAQVAGGGVLREMEKAINASVDAANGEPVKPTAIPLTGRFFGEVDADSVEMRRFFEAKSRINKAQSSMRAAEKAGDDAAALKIERENPEVGFYESMQDAQRRISKLNKQAIETFNDRERMKEIDAERITEMRELNNSIRQMESKAPTPGDRLRSLAD